MGITHVVGWPQRLWACTLPVSVWVVVPQRCFKGYEAQPTHLKGANLIEHPEEEDSQMRVLVTISGGAGAGKTTLAQAISEALSGSVVHLDDFYSGANTRAPMVVDDKGVLWPDVGDPRAVDWSSVNEALASKERRTSVVIVEGLFAASVNIAGNFRRLDIFVDLDADLRLVRRIQRKVIAESKPLESILFNYEKYRRHSHLRHIEVLRQKCAITVLGDAPTAMTAAGVRKLLVP